MLQSRFALSFRRPTRKMPENDANIAVFDNMKER